MNILYTLSGFGFGHASRTKIMVELLKKFGHQVKIATYGQGIDFLKDFFPEDLIEIKGFKNMFAADSLSVSKMALEIIKKIPIILTYNINVFRKITKKFKIDVIFNDFEPTSRWFARTTNIPLVTIDNQSLSHFGKLDISGKYKKDFLYINMLIGLFLPWGDWRFIVSFVPELTPLKKRLSPNSFIIPSPLRQEMFSLKTEKKDFVLVYQTAQVYKERLLKILSNLNHNFFCYNLGKGYGFKNIVFKKFSANGFLQDLASCKAVIINGGLTVMSEAIYFRKPIFSLPIKGDFEQILNGLILEKSGYGYFCRELKEEHLQRFLNNLSVYEEKLKNYQGDKNKTLEKKLLRVLRKIEYGE